VCAQLCVLTCVCVHLCVLTRSSRCVFSKSFVTCVLISNLLQHALRHVYFDMHHTLWFNTPSVLGMGYILLWSNRTNSKIDCVRLFCCHCLRICPQAYTRCTFFNSHFSCQRCSFCLHPRSIFICSDTYHELAF